MKFSIKYKYYDGIRGGISFMCSEYNCSTCVTRFLCYTNRREVVINDDKLYDELFDIYVDYQNKSHAQSLMRKRFFEYLGGVVLIG